MTGKAFDMNDLNDWVHNFQRLASTGYASVRVVERAGHVRSVLSFQFFRVRLRLLLFLYGELDGICGGPGSQVVHACFQAFFPGIKMHGS